MALNYRNGWIPYAGMVAQNEPEESDTDTVAAIAGGLAGLFYGYEGIPAKWLHELRNRNDIVNACRNM